MKMPIVFLNYKNGCNMIFAAINAGFSRYSLTRRLSKGRDEGCNAMKPTSDFLHLRKNSSFSNKAYSLQFVLEATRCPTIHCCSTAKELWEGTGKTLALSEGKNARIGCSFETADQSTTVSAVQRAPLIVSALNKSETEMCDLWYILDSVAEWKTLYCRGC